jgi:hypothetical protein
MKSDYDGAWKNLVENRLCEVLGLYFPQVEKEIDWQVAPKLLSQELKTFGIQEESLRGQRVDFLIEVVTLRGAKKVIFLHLEVQSRKERDFARRIYRYYQTISSQTRHDVVTLVVLADIDPGWQPCRYEKDFMGCRVAFEYPVCKLVDLLEGKMPKRSLAALAAQAQIAALQTSHSSRERLALRLQMWRELLGQGWQKEEILEAFRLLSWMMRLPRAEGLQFRRIVSDWPEMKTTAPMTDIEEIWLEEGIEKGIEKGRQEGRQEGRMEGRQEGLEKGIACGEWIGKVELLEGFLGKVPTPVAVLKNETLQQLKARFQKLEREYHKKHRG